MDDISKSVSLRSFTDCSIEMTIRLLAIEGISIIQLPSRIDLAPGNVRELERIQTDLTVSAHLRFPRKALAMSKLDIISRLHTEVCVGRAKYGACTLQD